MINLSQYRLPYTNVWGWSGMGWCMMRKSVEQIYNRLIAHNIEVVHQALPGGGTLLLFNYGGKLRAISGVSPDMTGATGRTIANNKYASFVVANQLGIPVPETVEYDDVVQAEAFLAKHGTVVVKPLDAAHGKGVRTGITSNGVLHEFAAKAKAESDAVLLQQQVSGDDLRVLIIDGKLAAVAQREPAAVVGDGERTISQLIDHENDTNALRGVNYEKPLNRIDKQAATDFIGETGLARVPAQGEQVRVVGTANIGTGGYAINKTNEVPAGLVAHAIRFADETRAFVCGVDFLYDTEAGKWYFIEANSSPNFGLHMWPSVGEPVDVATQFVDALLAVYEAES